MKVALSPYQMPCRVASNAIEMKSLAKPLVVCARLGLNIRALNCMRERHANGMAYLVAPSESRDRERNPVEGFVEEVLSADEPIC